MTLMIVSGDFINDHHNIKIGFEAEFYTTEPTKPWDYDETLSDVKCQRGNLKFELRVTGEVVKEGRGFKAELSTAAVPIYNTPLIYFMFEKMRSIMVAIGRSRFKYYSDDECISIRHYTGDFTLKDVDQISETWAGLQTSVSIPLGFFHESCINIIKAKQKFLDLFTPKQEGRPYSLRLDTVRRPMGNNAFKIGFNLKRIFCSDAEDMLTTNIPENDWTKDIHHLLPKIDYKFKSNNDACNKIKQGFNINRCNYHPETLHYIGDVKDKSIPCFTVEKDGDLYTGFVMEIRSGKAGFNSQISAFFSSNTRNPDFPNHLKDQVIKIQQEINFIWTTCGRFELENNNNQLLQQNLD